MSTPPYSQLDTNTPVFDTATPVHGSADVSESILNRYGSVIGDALDSGVGTFIESDLGPLPYIPDYPSATPPMTTTDAEPAMEMVGLEDMPPVEEAMEHTVPLEERSENVPTEEVPLPSSEERSENVPTEEVPLPSDVMETEKSTATALEDGLFLEAFPLINVPESMPMETRHNDMGHKHKKPKETSKDTRDKVHKTKHHYHQQQEPKENVRKLTKDTEKHKVPAKDVPVPAVTVPKEKDVPTKMAVKEKAAVPKKMPAAKEKAAAVPAKMPAKIPAKEKEVPTKMAVKEKAAAEKGVQIPAKEKDVPTKMAVKEKAAVPKKMPAAKEKAATVPAKMPAKIPAKEKEVPTKMAVKEKEVPTKMAVKEKAAPEKDVQIPAKEKDVPTKMAVKEKAAVVVENFSMKNTEFAHYSLFLEFFTNCLVNSLLIKGMHYIKEEAIDNYEIKTLKFRTEKKDFVTTRYQYIFQKLINVVENKNWHVNVASFLKQLEIRTQTRTAYTYIFLSDIRVEFLEEVIEEYNIQRKNKSEKIITFDYYRENKNLTDKVTEQENDDEFNL
ncbi:hypothetical protein O0L34_g333 [Tuta absoluta]|nr:hypothetical protein O0L34_g333 [Tuta absoluta]